MLEKEDKTADTFTLKKQQILETLNSVNPDEKLNYLVNRIVNIDIETSKAHNDALKERTSQVTILQKKVANLEKTLAKTEVAKSTLEELCRNLNNSKKETDRNYQKLRQVEEANREAMENFKISISDIQKSVENRKEQMQRMQDVEHLTTSLANLSSEYEKRLSDLKALYEEREQTIKSMVNSKDEELQHLKNQINEMSTKIKNVFQENVDLKRELMNSEQKVRTAIESELNARKMFDGYSQKYTDLMKTLETSNKAFDKTKGDMMKMNAQLIKLQGEAFRSKKQLEESNKKILALSAEKLEFDKESAQKDQRIEKLKSLCRELQKGKAVDLNDAEPKTETEDSAVVSNKV